MSSPLRHDVQDGGTAPDSRAEELALEAADQKRSDERERRLARRRRFIEQLQGEGLILVLIVVFVLFMAIKAMNQLHRKQEEEPQSEPPPSREVQLLEEIRDALVKRVGLPARRRPRKNDFARIRALAASALCILACLEKISANSHSVE